MDLHDDIVTLNYWVNEARIGADIAESYLPTPQWDSFWNLTNMHVGDYILDLKYAIEELIYSMQWLLYGKVSTFNYLKWYTVHNGLYESGVSWEGIAEAWAKNDFEGAAVTIAFIDRMRQLIWNEPFSVKWAAQPELEY